MQDRPQSHPQRLELARFLLEEWDFYSGLIPVIFTFRYTDNEENRKRGRVGRIAGFRQGTRNLTYVPASDHPRSRSNDFSTRRYYDFGRGEWRSFSISTNRQVTITGFWSDVKQEFLPTPEEALFDIDPSFVPEFQELQRRRKKSVGRSRKKRDAQIRREARRQEKRLQRTR